MASPRPKLSAAGWAFITGLAILANPRVVPSSKTVVIDAQLYLGPTDEDLVIGSLRYFNSANLTFDDGPNLYAITATVNIVFLFLRQQMTYFQFARRECIVDLLVPQMGYTFIGDIHSVSDSSYRLQIILKSIFF